MGRQAASLAGIGKGAAAVIGARPGPRLRPGAGPGHPGQPVVDRRRLRDPGRRRGGELFPELPADDQDPGLFSFSTQIGDWSFQGEYSYKLDAPLQINFADVTQAGLAPTFVDLGWASGSAATLNAILAGLNTNALIRRAGGITLANYTKFYNFTWQGYENHDVQQLQFTGTKVMGPHLGADQLVFVGEVGADYVPGLESHETLPFNGPNTPQSANVNFPNTAPQDVQVGGFPTKFSWGYTGSGSAPTTWRRSARST